MLGSIQAAMQQNTISQDQSKKYKGQKVLKI